MRENYTIATPTILTKYHVENLLFDTLFLYLTGNARNLKDKKIIIHQVVHFAFVVTLLHNQRMRKSFNNKQRKKQYLHFPYHVKSFYLQDVIAQIFHDVATYHK